MRLLNNFICYCLLLLLSNTDNVFAQFEKLHDFATPNIGITPSGYLAYDSLYLYGTTHGGGNYNAGTIYKVKKDGTGYQRLFDFEGNNTGYSPMGGLELAGEYLYGTCFWGGQFLNGTIYKIKKNGTEFQILHSFNGINGSNPTAKLTSKGSLLFGVTLYGGNSGNNYNGNIFRINKDGSNFMTLHYFNATNGFSPSEGLIIDDTYTLYGVTPEGGGNGGGTIFKINYDGTGFLTLFSFNNTYTGKTPRAELLEHDGYLFGTTYGGGVNDYGTIFKIKKDGTNYTKLHEFNNTDGRKIISSLKIKDNYLYGTASYGGTFHAGTFFKINIDGSDFESFFIFGEHENFFEPTGNLIIENESIYGTCSYGGFNNAGGLYKIKIDGSDFEKLIKFGAPLDGAYCYNGLISVGEYLYGMTPYGGTNGQGIIFRIRPNGTNFSKIYDFKGKIDGSEPNGSLIFVNGKLYGLTKSGGQNNYGVIFNVDTSGTDFAKIFDFNGINGKYPFGTLTKDSDYLYGSTYYGGINNQGTIFRIMPNGSNFNKLFDFEKTSSNCYPQGKLSIIDNYIYGMTDSFHFTEDTMGTIFKLKTDGANFQNLLIFNGYNGSSATSESQLLPIGEYLYGLTFFGGNFGMGTIFKIKNDGTNHQILQHFHGPNGANPHGTMILDGDFLYGATAYANSTLSLTLGDIFKIKKDGSNFSKVHNFSNSLSGGNPFCTLYSDRTYLYGTTQKGGSADYGTIFRKKFCDPPVLNAYVSTNKVCIGDEVVFSTNTIPLVVDWENDIVSGVPYTITENSTYTANAYNIITGCGNSAQVNVSVSNVSIYQNGKSLYANEFSDEYKWLNCETNTIIDGINENSFTPSKSGYYSVIIDLENCSDTSDCFYYNKNTSVNDFENNKNELQIFPNPTNGFFKIKHKSDSNFDLNIYNAQGACVLTNTDAKNEAEVNISNLPKGIYLVRTKIGVLKSKNEFETFSRTIIVN